MLDTDFTIETGELTPTLKLKRNVIHDSYKKAIADLYIVIPQPPGLRTSRGSGLCSLNRPGCYRCRSVDAMSAQHGDSGFGDMTLSVHGGNDTAGPSIRTPITMANSYHLPEPEKLDWSDPDHHLHAQHRRQSGCAATQTGPDGAR